MRIPGNPTVAYLAMIPFNERERLDPRFEGGMQELRLDMTHPEGHPLRGMDLRGCIRQHLRVPPELLGSMPLRIVIRARKGKSPPDFGLAPWDWRGVLAPEWGGGGLVSESFVNIVERLEPDRHQFLPIPETVDKIGRNIEKQYFLMNILQQINAVDVERSSVSFREMHHSPMIEGKKLEFTSRTMQFLKPYTLVLKRPLITGHHLWHGTNNDIFHVFFSRELYDAVHAANLSPLEYLQAEES
jgi:hypothetical protein